MKRILLKIIFVATALCIVFQPFTTVSQSADIYIDDGDEFNITAELNFDEPAYGVCLDVLYDRDILEFVSADKASNDTGGRIKISFSESGSASTSVTLRFKAKSGGNTTVKFCEIYYAGEGGCDREISDITVPVNITPTVMGDANNDGIVDITDLICVKKYISGIACEIKLKAADLNGDGAVNAEDIIRLKQLLVNQD